MHANRVGRTKCPRDSLLSLFNVIFKCVKDRLIARILCKSEKEVVRCVRISESVPARAIKSARGCGEAKMFFTGGVLFAEGGFSSPVGCSAVCL